MANTSTLALTELEEQFATVDHEDAPTHGVHAGMGTVQKGVSCAMALSEQNRIQEDEPWVSTASLQRLPRSPNTAMVAVGDGRTLSDLQAELKSLVARWHARKSRHLHADHAWRNHTSSEAFSRRIAVKFARAILEADPTLPPRPAHDLANIMADAWSGFMTATGSSTPSTSFPKGEKLAPPDALALVQDFSTDEVASALKRCKRSKSGGPDGRPNAW